MQKKKAGLVVGAALLGMLALSPLAFADDGGDGAVNGGNGNDVNVPLQGCHNDINGVGGQVEGLTLSGLGTSQAGADTCAQPSDAG